MQSTSRRAFLKSSALGFGAFCVSRAGLRAAHGVSHRRPNIIFLLTDDQRWDTMGCVGNQIIQTPHMDALAGGGVRFRNAFVTTSICCSSRASLFAGQYSRRHGINDFVTHFSEAAWQDTYPARLKSAGYRLGFIGKYGVGRKRDFPMGTFDYWRGIAGQPVYEQKDKEGNYKHLTQIMGEQSIAFLRGCSDERPFCLSVSFKAPHVQDGDPRQFIYDPTYKDLYKDDRIPLPKTASKTHFETLPEFLRDDATTARVRWQIRFQSEGKYQESVRGYYRLITGVDVVIGRIRAELDRRGLADNTVIMLMGDNGFFLAEHGFAGKWYGYEESVRVPLLVYDPRLPSSCRGQVRNEIALNVDVASTILSLAGVPVPAAMQGCDLTPLTQGQKRPWRSDFFYEHLFINRSRQTGANLIPQSEGVVSLRYKYLRYPEQDPAYEQLFDLAADPFEERNLAGDARCESLLKTMRARWRQLRRDHA
ncbi:MAG: sulfatase family protein [Planctomycetota bacterium]|jgi:arylsulfatase A-like enzyme